MKTKLIWSGAVVAALAGTWLGLATWRTHQQRVTLHVRNAPLATVLDKVQRQTHQKIRFDQKLDAKITLDVKNAPLAQVLDTISEQAGARWGRTYAVYVSDRSLTRLEKALQGDSDLLAAGWTNIAPRFDNSMKFPPAEFGAPGPGKVIMTSPPNSSDGTSPTPNKGVIVDEDVRDTGPASHNPDGLARTVTKVEGTTGERRIIKVGPGTPMIRDNESGAGPDGPARNLTVRRVAGPAGVTTTIMDGDGRVKVMRTSPDGTLLNEDEWSSERLVIETQLTPKLGDAIPPKATPETAAQAARKVSGKYVTYYALDKPPIPGSEAMGGLARSTIRRVRREGGTNHLDINGDIHGQVEAQAKQHRLDELSKSPEQQVQRARQKQQATAP